ncbi:MAG: hypothetical protein M4D80_29960 [Myxococcota bacterium]|nr:hypothetical protein [Myxococcota bacterium]
MVDDLPDARDGLTRLERIILWQLDLVQKETGRHTVPTAMLYGRVVEHISVSVQEFQRVLQKLVLSDRPPA